jgi:hypothetical protein
VTSYCSAQGDVFTHIIKVTEVIYRCAWTWDACPGTSFKISCKITTLLLHSYTLM